MEQYWSVKTAHPDKIVLFRMGDFFEMFHDDAVLAAPLLGIALTQRNKKSGDSTPMCGVPHHSIAEKINRLLAIGHKVAICDQVEDPKQAKGLVKRAVTRILSPGMVYDPDTLASDQANYLCAFEEDHTAFLDATTGEAFYYSLDHGEQRDHLLDLLKPVELVLNSEQKAPSFSAKTVTVFEDFKAQGEEPLACQRLRAYGLSMQGEELGRLLSSFEKRSYLGRMKLTPTVLKHLEVFQTVTGEAQGSLYHAINRTKTSGGARLLKSWLTFPLVSVEALESRQNQVAFWLSDSSRLEETRKVLSGLGDLERRWGKLSQPQFSPLDLKALQTSLRVALDLSATEPMEGVGSEHVAWAQTWWEMIQRFLVDEVPVQFRNGQFVRQGYHEELDEWIELATQSQKAVQALELREKEATGISSLKVRYNNVFGFYIEVTNAHKERVPLDRYQRKQTLTQAERFTTDELVELERKVLQARTRRVELEVELFEELRKKLLEGHQMLRDWARALAHLDVVTSLSWLALERGYCRPLLGAEGGLFIEQGRHPVVEASLRGSVYMANDLSLKPGEGLLITGPNMAGKSTYMRQVALISLMAQIGSFVPAQKAELQTLEGIFTRVGSSDSLTEGLSTFMLEMTETAEMLRGAGPRTLVVLDEVGRGTSTYDGLSLAQAILEHLVSRTGAYTLFATHYHELTELEHPALKNVHMAAQERGGDIKFLYSVVEGAAQKSYGIQVARLAGLPESVTQRASDLLRSFEQPQGSAPPTKNQRVEAQLPLFVAPDPQELREKNALRRMRSLRIEELTPLQALNELHLLKAGLDKELGDAGSADDAAPVI